MFALVLTSQSLFFQFFFFLNFGLFWFVFDLWINHEFKLKIPGILMINKIDLSPSLCFETMSATFPVLASSECSQSIISIRADFVL